MNCYPSKPCQQADTCAHHRAGNANRVDGTAALINRMCFLFEHKTHPTVQARCASDNRCVRCGQEGHRSHACKLPVARARFDRQTSVCEETLR